MKYETRRENANISHFSNGKELNFESSFFEQIGTNEVGIFKTRKSEHCNNW